MNEIKIDVTAIAVDRIDCSGATIIVRSGSENVRLVLKGQAAARFFQREEQHMYEPVPGDMLGELSCEHEDCRKAATWRIADQRVRWSEDLETECFVCDEHLPEHQLPLDWEPCGPGFGCEDPRCCTTYGRMLTGTKAAAGHNSTTAAFHGTGVDVTDDLPRELAAQFEHGCVVRYTCREHLPRR